MTNQKIIISLLTACLMVTSLYASEAKGKKLYIQKCKKCHGTGGKGASMQTMDEWEDMFANDGEEIIEKHEKPGAKGYFNSPKFQRNAPHLKDFLHTYGSDSGNVPSC